ncbi:MAG: patatin-like phospholipase family protein [Rhodobacteraceae bacterium]|nr:patatin-like phospholipase family protein [Paracoccaceae bacterium]
MTDTGGNQQTAFVLQGGGALGAYQGGAVSRLAEAGQHPAIVAGISIGAINAALVAGNPPDRRAEALRTFWTRITAAEPWPFVLPGLGLGAALSVTRGAPGFFVPRFPPAAFAPQGDPTQASFYDTAPLRATLEELVDFDLLNGGPVRLTVGAVDVESGNFIWFDSAERRIGPEHIMASGALPPGFAAVEVDGHPYWDGGLVSNTPLARVVETRDARPLTVWQFDLFSARGQAPHSVWGLEAREKDIRYSSRTRSVTDAMRARHMLASALMNHRAGLPQAFLADPAVVPLLDRSVCAPLTLIQLIYRSKPYETGAKDYDFSRAAMEAHWAAGLADVFRTLAHDRMRAHDHRAEGMHVFDLTETSHAGVPDHE